MTLKRDRDTPGGPITRWQQPSPVRANTVDFIHVQRQDVLVGAREESGFGDRQEATSLRDFLAGDLNGEVSMVFGDEVLAEVLQTCRVFLGLAQTEPSGYALRLDHLGVMERPVLQFIRQLTGLGAAQAFALGHSAPVTLTTLSELDDARALRAYLEDLGAEATVVGDDAPTPHGNLSGVSKTTADLFLDDSGPKRIRVIRLLREITGDSLADTKALVDHPPSERAVACALPLPQAIHLRDALIEAGASARLQTLGVEPPTPSGVFGLYLDNIGPRKIQVIKITRSLSGLGLRAAKERVESAPVQLASGLSRAEAERALQELLMADAEARISEEGEVSEPVPERSDVRSADVYLDSFGHKKIAVIKAVRTITGLGLKDAKHLVERAPTTVLEGVTLDDALSAVHALNSAGGSARVEGIDAAPPEPVGESMALFLEEVGPRKIAVIKAVRTITGLGLKDAKHLVERAPTTVLEGLSASDAKRHAADLEAARATVRIDAK